MIHNDLMLRLRLKYTQQNNHISDIFSINCILPAFSTTAVTVLPKKEACADVLAHVPTSCST